MSIEYIGEITLKAPQHIEDKLTALAEKATQGPWKRARERQEYLIFGGGFHLATVPAQSHLGYPDDTHADLIVALHNAAPALLAVVRAARAALNEEWLPPHKRTGAMVALEDAIEALDTVVV